MTLRVESTPEAEAQFRAIEAWWRDNRPRAPDLFSQEFASCLDLISSLPGTGRIYLETEPPVRRVLMRAARNHIYYQLFDDKIVVLSVWSAVRGSGPPLKA